MAVRMLAGRVGIVVLELFCINCNGGPAAARPPDCGRATRKTCKRCLNLFRPMPRPALAEPRTRIPTTTSCGPHPFGVSITSTNGARFTVSDWCTVNCAYWSDSSLLGIVTSYKWVWPP